MRLTEENLNYINERLNIIQEEYGKQLRKLDRRLDQVDSMYVENTLTAQVESQRLKIAQLESELYQLKQYTVESIKTNEEALKSHSRTLEHHNQSIIGLLNIK